MFDLVVEHVFCIVPNMRSISTDPRAGIRALLLALLLVLVIGALLVVFQKEAVSAPGREEMTTVVVQPGDTLWEIADRFAPESADLRVVISELAALNGLQSKFLKPGQVLQVPVDRL